MAAFQKSMSQAFHSLDNNANSGEPSMVIAADGTPYIAWRDESSGDCEIYVRRWME